MLQMIKKLLPMLPWAQIGLFVGGLVIGLIWAYIVSPMQFENATPHYLRADLQEDYFRMAVDSYKINPDANLAAARWQNLGTGAEPAHQAVSANPGGDPAAIASYYQVASVGGTPTAPVQSSIIRTIVLMIGLLFLLGIAGYAGLYMYRLLNNRGSGVVTVTMQAAEASRNAEKTNFEQMGLAPPITQTMTTYVLGDDLYDESFSIDTAAGEFMGEYGVGVSESIGVGEPKKVTALEFWLFDKNDIKTATKVLMSEHAFNDAAIRARLEPKGELSLVQPQVQVLLETATLQLLATVVDLEYGRGSMPTNSYFERITLELAIWPRQQTQG